MRSINRHFTWIAATAAVLILGGCAAPEPVAEEPSAPAPVTATPTVTPKPEHLGDEILSVTMTAEHTDGEPVDFTLTAYAVDESDTEARAALDTACDAVDPSVSLVVVDVVATPADRTLATPFLVFSDNYFHGNTFVGDGLERTSSVTKTDVSYQGAAECTGDLTISTSAPARITIGYTESSEGLPDWSSGRFGFLSQDELFADCETQLTSMGEKAVTAGIQGWNDPWETEKECSVGTYITH